MGVGKRKKSGGEQKKESWGRHKKVVQAKKESGGRYKKVVASKKRERCSNTSESRQKNNESELGGGENEARKTCRSNVNKSKKVEKGVGKKKTSH